MKNDGSVVTWGNNSNGGDSSGVSNQLTSGVEKIYSTNNGFAALKNDGSVVTWGNGITGYSDIDGYLQSDVIKIYSGNSKFIAIKNDKSVIEWGFSAPQTVTSITASSMELTGSDPTHLSLSEINDPDILILYPKLQDVNIVHITASSSGDPYITTLCGNKFKLPNITKTYRMVQFTDSKNKDLIVNASVSQLTKEEIEQLENTTLSFTDLKPVTNGYFYESFYISYGNKYVVFDRHINIIYSNISIENIQNDHITIKYETEPKPFSCPIQGNSTSIDTVITLGNSIIRLQKINHPQIINGIEFSTEKKNVTMVKGILNTYYHPKNYSIKKLESTKQISDNNKKLYKKNVIEKWIDV